MKTMKMRYPKEAIRVPEKVRSLLLTSRLEKRLLPDYVTVKASGVKADEVTALGVQGGTGKDAEGSLRASVGGGQTSATLKIVSGLRAETTYYVKAYLKTKEGTVYSSVKKVTTP